MSRQEKNYKVSVEMDLALKLSQLEGAFRFLDYVNNEKTVTGHDMPRNTTERSSVKTNLARIKEVRQLYKSLLNKHHIVSDPVSGVDCSIGA